MSTPHPSAQLCPTQPDPVADPIALAAFAVQHVLEALGDARDRAVVSTAFTGPGTCLVRARRRNKDGALGHDHFSVLISPRSVRVGAGHDRLADPMREGLDFLHWSSRPGGSVDHRELCEAIADSMAKFVKAARLKGQE